MRELFMYVPLHPTYRVPVLPNACSTLFCHTHSLIPLGDQNSSDYLVIATVLDVEISPKREILLVWRNSYAALKSG